MTIKPVPSEGFETTISVLVVGGGAAGLCAALAAHEAGAEVAIFERDPLPRGSTALSAGLIPAVAVLSHDTFDTELGAGVEDVSHVGYKGRHDAPALPGER